MVHFGGSCTSNDDSTVYGRQKCIIAEAAETTSRGGR